MSEKTVKSEYQNRKKCKTQEIYNKNLDNMYQKVIEYDCMVFLGEGIVPEKTL